MAGRYKPYPEYKDTGIIGLNEIPLDWRAQRVKFLFNLGRGRVISQEELVSEGVYPVYSSQTKDSGCLGYINTFDFDCRQITWTTDGANAGTVFLREGKHNCTNVCGTLQPKSASISLEYFLYCLQYVTQFYKRPDTNGAKIMNGEMGEIFVSIPSRYEQDIIRDFLDHETAKIDTLIEKQQQLIQLLKEKRQAVISHAVTKGLNPNAKMRDSGVEWLGEVPEHWALSQPRYACSFVGGGTPTKENLDFWGGDIPWVSPKDMKQDYLSSAQDTITPAALSHSAVKLIDTGAVLIVVRGMILDHSVPVALSEVKLTINQDMKALIPNSKLDGEYLLYCLKGMRDNILDLVESSAHGTKCLRTEQFDRMALPLPPLNEQLKIIAQLKDTLSRIDKLTSNIELMIGLAIERRTALISAAVTGKIDVRNWIAPQAKLIDKEVAA
ncbi:restriction endonuclease subunit S [Pseudomonas sp. V1]|uniref:restriction endonuclease subunit S n=1 Tax=Pseudomonas arcuscaelestis TaxID=2710591 RepID=UPI00193F3E9D|nr:restriction endonuclease subunit S [Pseudomonas arcuscaelestis]MBM3107268.1 restriction endonuclease subunit S [Pseudomonas arcuscaelestis]